MPPTALQNPSARLAVAAGLLAYAALHGLRTVFHWGGPEVVARVAGTPLVLPGLAATVLTFWRARREPPGDARRGWQLFTSALALYSIGLVVWASYTVGGREIPFPASPICCS